MKSIDLKLKFFLSKKHIIKASKLILDRLEIRLTTACRISATKYEILKTDSIIPENNDESVLKRIDSA